MEGFIGQIIMMAGTYAPRGWMICDGSVLHIQEYGSLYAVIGAFYGGDGRTTFALPDLRGRIPLGVGMGPGLSDYYKVGLKGGYEEISLDISEMPAHDHIATAELEGSVSIGATDGTATTSNPKNAILANSNGVSGRDPVNVNTYASGNANCSLKSTNNLTVSVDVQNTGSSEAHENRQPFLTINFCICIDGVFPPRS